MQQKRERGRSVVHKRGKGKGAGSQALALRRKTASWQEEASGHDLNKIPSEIPCVRDGTDAWWEDAGNTRMHRNFRAASAAQLGRTHGGSIEGQKSSTAQLSRQGSLLMSAAGLGLECRVGVSAREREACQGVWCSAVQGGWAERAAVRASANLLVRCSVVSARWPQRSGLSYGPARCRRASRDYRAG